MNSNARRHLRTMLDRHERWCRANGVEVPEDVVVLVDLLTDPVRSGQERSNSDGGGDLVDDAVVPLAVDFAAAGRRLGGVSVSTVRRLVAAGELAAVSVGGRRLVPVCELEGFLVRKLDQQQEEIR